jgi:hypothetical protein
MSSDAIRAVTHGLRALLISQLAAGRKVTLLPPGDDPPAGGSGVNLYLYRLAESPYLKNQPWPGDQSGTPGLPEPVLSLGLSYLLTPFGPLPQPDDADDEAHRALGEAMLALHEHPVLNQTHVPGFDADSDLPTFLLDGFEDIKIRLTPTSVEELSKIWAVIGKPYRVSVAYEVELVQLVPTQVAPAGAAPVASTGLTVIALAAPRLSSITPASGPVATVAGPSTLQLNGFGFSFPGQLPAVTIAATAAELVGAPTDTQLTVLMPATLPAGPEVDVRVRLNGRTSPPLRFTVEPWASTLTPVRTALDGDVPADANLTVTGQALAPTTEVRVDGAGINWRSANLAAGSGPGMVRVSAPGGGPSNAAPGTGLRNGVYEVRVRRTDDRLTNPLDLEVIPLLDQAASGYAAGTRLLSLRGARLDGADVRIRIDGQEYATGANANGGIVTYQFGRPLGSGDHAVTVDVDGHRSRPITVQV